MKQLLYLILAVFFTSTLAACSQETVQTTEPETKAVTAMDTEEEEHELHTHNWSYKGETAPEHWADLNSDYAACANGSEQSPINIEFSQAEINETIENVDIRYEPTTFSLMNNGHTIQANTVSQNNKIIHEGEEYQLIQFHFHTPSEHQFNGQMYAMELHFVHQNEDGELAVLGVMIQEGTVNKALQSVWDALPEEKTEDDIAISEPIDLQALLPVKQTSFYYEGSLTTPPCTEGVEWIVFEQPIEMANEQIEAFQQIFPDNHRPVQLLDGREVMKDENNKNIISQEK